MGAEPVTHTLTLPPKAFLVLLKIKASYNQCLYLALPCKPLSLDLVPLLINHYKQPPFSLKVECILSYILLYNLGTDPNIVGCNILKSSFNFKISP